MSFLAKRAAAHSARMLMAGIVLSCCGFAFAENLPDPTRPSGVGMLDAGVAGAVSSPVLQSVFVSPGRRVAIINGQSVKLGEKVGEARVAKITETEVTLAQNGEMQVLKLFAQVDKRLSQTSSRPQTEIRR